MKQSINFIKDKPQNAQQLPAKWIILAGVTLLALLTTITIFMTIRLVNDNLTVNRIRTENSQVTTVFQQAAKKYPLLASEMPLAIQISVLEKQLQDKKSHFEAITGSTLRYGFSHYLETLAKITPQGLWLSKMSINQETRRATISGYMIKPVDVSVLLQALQDSKAFSGTQFNVFYINNISGKAYTEFRLTNEEQKG